MLGRESHDLHDRKESVKKEESGGRHVELSRIDVLKNNRFSMK